MIEKIKKLIIGGTIFALLCGSAGAISTRTDPNSDPTKASYKSLYHTPGEMKEMQDSFTEVNCYELDDFMKTETAEFLDWLNTTFQNKSWNSGLKDQAILRFFQHKNRMHEITEIYYNYLMQKLNLPTTDEDDEEKTPDQVIKEQLNNFASIDQHDGGRYICQDLKNDYIEKAEKMMMNHIKTTSYQKKTTVFIQKYQAINSKLRDLNFAIAKMYAYFYAFNEKVPCFIEDKMGKL